MVLFYLSYLRLSVISEMRVVNVDENGKSLVPWDEEICSRLSDFGSSYDAVALILKIFEVLLWRKVSD